MTWSIYLHEKTVYLIGWWRWKNIREFVMPLIVFSCCAGGILLGQARQAVLAQWNIKVKISTKLPKWTQSLFTHARKSSVMKRIACLCPSFKWLLSRGCSWLLSLGFLCFCLFDKPLKLYSICCFHGCSHASVIKAGAVQAEITGALLFCKCHPQ